MSFELTIDNIHQHFRAKNPEKQQQLLDHIKKLMELMALLNTSHHLDFLKKSSLSEGEQEKQRDNNLRVQDLQNAAHALNGSINQLLEHTRIKHFFYYIPYNTLNDAKITFIAERANLIDHIRSVVKVDAELTHLNDLVDNQLHLESVTIHQVDSLTLWKRRIALVLCVVVLFVLLLALGLMLASPTPSIFALFGVFVLGIAAIPGLFGFTTPATETMNATTYGVEVPTEIPVPMIMAPLVAPIVLIYLLRHYIESWTVSPPLEQKMRDLDFNTFIYDARLIKCRIALDNKHNNVLLAVVNQAERIYHSGINSMIEGNYQTDVAKAVDLLLAVQKLTQEDCENQQDILAKRITLRKNESETSLAEILDRSRNPLLDKICFWRNGQTESRVSIDQSMAYRAG